MDKLWLLVAFVVAVSYAANAQIDQQTSKWDFHQNDYDIKLERAEVISFNHSYIGSIRADFVPHNRTQRVLNGSVEVIVDMPGNNAKLDIQVYKFMSNEYRFFPITISVNPCEEYTRNTLGCRDILNDISNCRGCPVKKGFYYLTKGLPDFSRFPPLIPRGQYKMTTIWYRKTEFLAEVHFYGSVMDKPTKWQV